MCTMGQLSGVDKLWGKKKVLEAYGERAKQDEVARLTFRKGDLIDELGSDFGKAAT